MSGSLHQLIASGRQALVQAGFAAGDAALDAEVLARHVLGWDLARLLAHDREPATDAVTQRFQSAIRRRISHEPVAMIVGHREFWNLDFTVTPATLVPRPETELIVEEALKRIPRDAPATILDIGTGTGCLAIALMYERPSARAVATDLSHDALLVARENARTHGVDGRVRFVQTDLAGGLRLRADVIVSNPPYVPLKSAPALPPEVAQYEPALALFGGDDGLAVMRRLLQETPRHVARGGTLIVEFGFGQEMDVRAAAEREGWTTDRVLEDLQGIARTVVLRRTGD